MDLLNIKFSFRNLKHKSAGVAQIATLLAWIHYVTPAVIIIGRKSCHGCRKNRLF
jgi:hypothetical protein